jgi:hypothetical protein
MAQNKQLPSTANLKLDLLKSTKIPGKAPSNDNFSCSLLPNALLRAEFPHPSYIRIVYKQAERLSGLDTCSHRHNIFA